MSLLPSYRDQQSICCANQLTGFYMRVTMAFNGLKRIVHDALTCYTTSIIIALLKPILKEKGLERLTLLVEGIKQDNLE